MKNKNGSHLHSVRPRTQFESIIIPQHLRQIEQLGNELLNVFCELSFQS